MLPVSESSKLLVKGLKHVKMRARLCSFRQKSERTIGVLVMWGNREEAVEQDVIIGITFRNENCRIWNWRKVSCANRCNIVGTTWRLHLSPSASLTYPEIVFQARAFLAFQICSAHLSNCSVGVGPAIRQVYYLSVHPLSLCCDFWDDKASSLEHQNGYVHLITQIKDGSLLRWIHLRISVPCHGGAKRKNRKYSLSMPACYEYDNLK